MNFHRKLTLLLVCTTLLMNTLAAQRDSGWVPFEFVKKAVIVPVTIADQPYRFVLDTGGILEISPSIQDRLQLPVMDKVTITGINKAEKELHSVSLPNLMIGDLSFTENRALVTGQNTIYPSSCFAIDGMIGRDLLNGLVLQLDHANLRFRLTDTPAALSLDTTARTPTRYGLRKVVEVQVDLEGESQFIKFDLGSSDLFSYQTKQAKRQPKQSRRACEGLFSFGVTQKGIKTQRRYRNRIPSLSIAGVTFSDFWSDFSKTSSARIGAGLLPYGRVTLDYINAWFYFEPYQEKITVQAAPTPGFAICYNGDKYVVKWVLQKSAAAVAGLQEGLEVLSINDLQLNTIDDHCFQYLNNYPMLDITAVEVRWLDKNGQIQEVTLSATNW